MLYQYRHHQALKNSRKDLSDICDGAVPNVQQFVCKDNIFRGIEMFPYRPSYISEHP